MRIDRCWIMLGVIFLARISMGFQFQSVASMAPFLVADLHLSYTQIGWLIGVFSLPGAVIALPGGLLGQRVGPRHLAVLSLVVMIAGAVTTAVSGGFLVACLGRVASGAGMIVLGIAFAQMVADWFAGKELATAMGVMLTAWPTGIALALISLGAVAGVASWRLGMHVTALVTVAALLLMVALYRDPPGARHAPAGGATPARLSRHEAALAVAGGLAWGALNAALLVFVAFAPAALTAGGASITAAGFLVSLGLWATLPSVPIGGYLADRLGHPDLIIGVGCAATALLTAAVVVLPGPGLWAFLAGVAIGGAPGAIMSLLPKAIAPARLASAFGLFYSVYYLGVAVAQPLAGLLRDRSALPAAPVFFAAALMLLTPLWVAVFRELERRRPSPAASVSRGRPRR